MISLQHNCLFIHVPRTGGTSIERSGLFTLPQPQHWRAQDYFDLLGAGAWWELYRFAFVRNPWDRAVSAYLNAGEVRNPEHWGFEKWCCDFFANNDFRWRGEWGDRTKREVFEQWEMLSIDGVLADFSYLGQYEMLQEGFDIVCGDIELPQTQLQHINQTREPGEHYSQWHTPETRDAIARRFAKDIELFAYEYEEQA